MKTTNAADVARNKGGLNAAGILKRQGAIIALVLLVLVIGIASPQFRTVSNLLSLLRQASINGVIAFGMTCVILTGGIDISVGAILGLSAMLGAGFFKGGMPELLAIPLMLILGLGLGAINGTLVTLGRLQPFIATLITMTAYRGFCLIYGGGKPISSLGDQPLLNSVGRGDFAGVPIPVWILLLIFALFFFILNKTTLGRRIYAVGSNSVAAKLAGVNIGRTKLFVYGISGLMSALAGLVLLSRLGSAQPTLGAGYEIDAIAATALGGTSMSGGSGKIYGTMVGVLIIAILSNGLNILGVSSYYQDVVKSAVILLAVLSDRGRRASV
ncbi:MAG: ribose ABC transporter permease [Spirochaetaceae bacterium]|jgi:ribose transport system permease protein|nr:ribose ABC transporter permease [Spirochaetaceae bacterium]